MIEKIISGGQTGADRAALDVALELGLATGGWVPHGRRAEDGRIPERYGGMVETESDSYDVRTELNVRDSSGTVVFSFGPPVGGTALTVERAGVLRKPVVILDLEHCRLDQAIQDLTLWLARERPRVLNVAGARQSEEPRIAKATAAILREALRRVIA